MNDRETTQLLDELARQISVGPAPIDSLIRQGRARKYGRRTATVLVSVAGTCVAVAGIVFATATLAERTPGTGSSIPTAGKSTLEIPNGMRLVGYGGVTVSVPQGWSTDQTKCGQPLADTVYLQTDGQRGCLVEADGPVNSLAIAATSSFVGQALAGTATEPVEINGISARQTGVADEADGTVTQSIVVPEEQVVFTLSVADKPTLQAIRESLRSLPEGFTSVPFGLAGTANPSTLVERAGLEASIVEKARPTLAGGTLLDVVPAPGSVLALGDGVTLTVVPGDPPAKN
jgi:hypothetical protein